MPGSEQISSEMGIGPQGFKAHFTGPEFTLIVQNDRIAWRPRNTDDPTLTAVERSADGLLDLLSVTPISAVGINFGFDLERGADALIEQLLAMPDNEQLKAAGAHQRSITVKRSFEFRDESLNISVERDAGKEIRIDLNFHRDVSGAKDAKEGLAGSVVHRKALALDLLNSVYGLELENL